MSLKKPLVIQSGQLEQLQSGDQLSCLVVLPAGTIAAGTAPLVFTSGVSLTTPVAGSVEFTTDNLYFTITTGAARKNLTLDEGLTSGRVSYATTNGRLTDSANLTFDGTNLSTSIPYGEMYGTNISQQVTASGTIVLDAPTQVPAGLTGGTQNTLTFQNARELKVSVAGKYLITWSMSVECTTNNQEAEGGIMINASAKNNATAHTELGTSGSSKPECISGSGIFSLSINDLISLYLLNHTATNNLVLQHVSLTALRIGN